MGFDAREQRKEIFQDTLELCRNEERLQKAIRETMECRKIILETDSVPEAGLTAKYDVPAKIVVSGKRSLEAAKGYAGQRVCVLNFASATNPGGGVCNGSNAQEEAICRCSTLYPCISDGEVREKFHDRHKNLLKLGKMDALYNGDCIYTPGITVFKTDTAHPQKLAKEDWYRIDVISCAAPNLRRNPSNSMNPGSGSQAVSIGQKELLELHKKRIGRILSIAGANGAETVILGAFGCGAFQNPPKIVAQAMEEIVREFLYGFRTIEFAIYCRPGETRNYDIFSNIS